MYVCMCVCVCVCGCVCIVSWVGWCKWVAWVAWVAWWIEFKQCFFGRATWQIALCLYYKSSSLARAPSHFFFWQGYLTDSPMFLLQVILIGACAISFVPRRTGSDNVCVCVWVFVCVCVCLCVCVCVCEHIYMSSRGPRWTSCGDGAWW